MIGSWRRRARSLALAACGMGVILCVTPGFVSRLGPSHLAGRLGSPAFAGKGDIEIETVMVPGGKFLMGDSVGAGEFGERPAHLVWVSPFRMQRCEVTRGEYVRFLNEVGARVYPLFVISFGHEYRGATGVAYAGRPRVPLVELPDGGLSYHDGLGLVRRPIVFGRGAGCRRRRSSNMRLELGLRVRLLRVLSMEVEIHEEVLVGVS